MANPQPDKFIRYSKEFDAALAKARISGVQHQVLKAIIFYTWGAVSPVKEAQISQKEFMEYTELNTVAISKAKTDLLEMNLITKFGNKLKPTYRIQKDYDSWNLLPKKVISRKIKGSQRSPKKLLPKLVTTVTKIGNNSNSHLISSKNKEQSECVYKFYLLKISPLRKSSKRAKENITYYLKKYTESDLKKSIENYAEIAKKSDPQYRKDPANFFGKNDRFFIDYLPGNFEQASSASPQKSKEINAENVEDFYANP